MISEKQRNTSQGNQSRGNQSRDRAFNLALINQYEQALFNADESMLHELMQTIDELTELVYGLPVID